MSRSTVDRSVVPGAGALRPFHFPNVERVTLDNGLPLLFARTGGLPVTTLSLLLPAGGLHEPPGKEGVGTLAGSLLESGTTEIDAAGVSERLEGLGVRLHVGTSWEVSHVDFTSLTGELEEAGELMAGLVREPAFPQSEVERLRNEQLASILQRRAEPRGFANELASRFIFAQESPFSRPLHGTSHSVSSLQAADVRDYHSRHYTPSLGAVVIAGHLDAGRAFRAADAIFGRWIGPPAAPVEAVIAPRVPGPRLVIVDRPGAVQSEIRVGHIGVARNTPDYFSIVVMNTILGGAFSSRLNLNLRERHGFTYGVRSTFIMRRRPGPFIVSTAVQTEVTGAAVREIVTEIHRMRDASVSDAELADARQFVAGTFPLPLQTTDGVASRMAEIFIHDLPPHYLEQYAERILAVSVEDVLEAARKRLRPDQLTVVVLGDAQAVRPQLDSVVAGDVQVVAPDELQ